MPGSGPARARAQRREDFASLLSFQREARIDVASPRLLESRRRAFPEGQLIASSGAQVAGMLAALVVDWDDPGEARDWSELTGDGTFSTHDETGNTLFAAVVAAHPERAAAGALRALHQSARRLCRKLNLHRVVAAIALDDDDPESALRDAAWGNLDEPCLRVPMAQGFQCIGILADKHGPTRGLLVWVNPLYSPDGPPPLSALISSAA